MKKAIPIIVKFIPLLFLFFFLSACNVAKWYQNNLDKKFKRHGIFSYNLQTDSNKIHYLKGGSGPYLLLVHGFGGDAQLTWRKVIIQLSKKFTVIAPDLLWFGQSQSNSQPNIKSQSTALFELLNSLKVKKCKIAGVSYGGFVTLNMVNRNPSRFDKMCIIDCPGMTYNIELLDSLCSRENVDAVTDIFVPKKPQEVQRLYSLAFYKRKHLSKRILANVYKMYFSQNHKELTQLLYSLQKDQAQLTQFATSFTIPTIVIWGSEDAVFPIREGKKLANFLNANFKSINKTGHTPMLEQPKKFLNLIVPFMN